MEVIEAPTQPPLSLDQFQALLPVRIYQFNLCWLEAVTLPFFHQGVVTAFVRTLLKIKDSEFAALAIHTPESGRLNYQQGDQYSFYISLYGGDISLLEKLFFLFDRLPFSAAQAQCEGLFASNIRLLSIKDGLSQQLLAEAEHAAYIDQDSLNEQVALWRQATPYQIKLRFISPLRIKQEKGLRQNIKSSNSKLCHTQAEVNGSLLFDRLFDACAGLQQQLSPDSPRLKRVERAELDFTQADLFWVDGYYGSASHREQNKLKAVGGLQGEVTLPVANLSQADWLLLVLGQYIGMGQNRRFGCGRYQLLTADDQSMTAQLTRAEPLLEHICSHRELAENFKHELHKLPKSQQVVTEQGFDLAQLQAQLYSGQQWPEPLTPWLLQEPGKKERLLLLPCFEDKVIHKTLSSWLSETLDILYSANSYGYRRGHSRLGAKDKIQSLIRAGYQYVLDADIQDFFPSVSTKRILSRLACLYGSDQAWQLLERHLHAAIKEQQLPQGYEQFQPSGLNMGTSLSPVLANLMLDHLDSVLTNLDYQLIRYADDFLVLCKHRHQAEQALTLVKALLAEQGLELNPNKTKIRSFASGVEFLGYLFINDMVIESKPKPASQTPHIAHKPRVLPEHSQQLFFSQPQLQTLCIAGEPALIRVQQHRIIVERNSETLANIPISHLACLVLFGPHQITTQALTQSMQQQVPVYFASTFGRYQGTAAAIEHQPRLHLQQASHFSQLENRLAVAQALVTARIRSQKEVLRSRQVRSQILEQCLKQLPQAKSTEQCLGLEGQASAAYWREYAKLLPEPWEMPKRVKRGAADPVNSLLSFGYSLLYAHTDSLLRSQGLFPTLGGYHHSRGTHSALASDMMEPFRYLIERSALTVIKRSQIKPQQFTQHNNRCLLNDAARKFWCRYLVEQLQKPQHTDQQGQKRSVLQLIQQQNRNLLDWINGESEQFVPWLLR